MLPFSPPRIDNKIIDEVTETLKSGWITTGPKTKLFEKKLTAYTGCKSTICVNAATNGLEMILRWFGIGKGDEVIVPAYTYCATANVVVHCGATPVFADAKEDFNISAEAVKKAITSKTKAVMPVDFAGFPCDYDHIYRVVHNAKHLYTPSTKEQRALGRMLVLSDSAHSAGGIYKGKRTGNIADASVFSFHAVKNISTAEGGAIALNLPEPFDNEELYKHFAIKTLHGQDKDALAKSQKGNWRYDVVEAGYKCNMTDIQAAMGLVELDRYDNDTLVKRKHIFDRYSEALMQKKWAQLPLYETHHVKSAYHIYPLRIRNITEEQRNNIIQKIFSRDISVNVHFIPVPMLSFYSKLGYDIKDYPVAYDNYSREITLPVYYDLEDNQIDMVLKAVIESIENETNI